MRRPAEASRKSAILVLGPHRSGTSLVTRILNLLGFHLGRDLLGQHECNMTGLWENAAVVAWNEAFLAGIGSSWFDYRVMDVRQNPAAFDAAVQSLVEVLRDQFGEAGDIAIKDPRICRLVPLYHEALRRLGYEVRALVQHRLPLKTALSLYRRDGLPLAAGMRLWLAQTLQVLDTTRGWERLFVDYSKLLQAPDVEIVRIAAWLSRIRTHEGVADADIGKIAGFVNPHLETVSNSMVEPALLEEDVQELQARLYEGLCRATELEQAAPFPELDTWLAWYRKLSTTPAWQDCPLVTIVHAGLNDEPEVLQKLAGLAGALTGMVLIKDGEEGDAPGWAQQAMACGVGLMFNRVVRGESQSLVRGVGLARGHDVLLLLLRRTGCPHAARIVQQLRAGDASSGLVLLFVDAAAGPGEPDLAAFDADACMALFIPKHIAEGIDPWQCINANGDAITQLLAMLAMQGHGFQWRRVDAKPV